MVIHRGNSQPWHLFVSGKMRKEILSVKERVRWTAGVWEGKEVRIIDLRTGQMKSQKTRENDGTP